MKRIATLIAVLQMLVMGTALQAQEQGHVAGNTRTVSTEAWIEEWDPATGQWVRVSDVMAHAPTGSLPTITTHYVNGVKVSETREAARYAQPVAQPRAPAVLAQYGPFIVTSETAAAMVGSTDRSSPAYFDAMLRDFPEISRLDLIEAPGTSNDIANLAVGRRIRDNDIATHVPNGGSVRSGAVELFLAGATRTMDEGAQFAVHSWLDNHGREADDFAADHPAHRLYLDYYTEMGMSETQARDFYAMTNSVPHHSALWLDASDMRPWIRSDEMQVRVPAARMAKTDQAPAIFVSDERVMALVDAELPQIALESLTINLTSPVFAEAKPLLAYSNLSDIALAQLEVSHS